MRRRPEPRVWLAGARQRKLAHQQTPRPLRPLTRRRQPSRPRAGSQSDFRPPRIRRRSSDQLRTRVAGAEASHPKAKSFDRVRGLQSRLARDVNFTNVETVPNGLNGQDAIQVARGLERFVELPPLGLDLRQSLSKLRRMMPPDAGKCGAIKIVRMLRPG